MKLKIDKLKIKRILKIIAIIIFLIFLSLIIREICIQYDGKLDKSNPMSREEMLQLTEKGEDCKNYTVTYLSYRKIKREEQKIYIKDNLMKTTLGGNDIEWMNFDTGERIMKIGFPMTYISNEYDTDNIKSKEQYKEEHKGWAYSLIKDTESNDYEYLGEKDFNGRRTIVIKLKDIKYEENGYTKLYIDKETGINVKSMQFYRAKPFFILKGYTENMTIEFDNVTDEDVKRPNIAGSIVYDYREEM